MRKFTLFILSALVCSATLFAESGACGANLTWDLTDGVLTISGTGAMTDWYSSSYAPWYSYSSSIKEVSIGNSVTSIGNYAFQSCKSLTSVTIPNSVTSIGEFAFEYCTSLTSVTIPNSVTSIGSSAFYYCTSLTSVTIPNSVTSIGWYAFEDCSSLTSIDVAADNANYCSVDGLLFNKDMTTLIQYPIGNTRTSYTIPNSVSSIGDGAFFNCSSLTSVTIPNSVTSIGDYAFQYCSSLTSVTIGNSVTSIGNWAFSLCTSLTSVTIPNSVTSIGSDAFSRCSSLTSIDVAADNANYCSVDGVLFNKDMTTLIQYPIGNTRTSYTIPNSVTSIGGEAFRECTSLTSVTIPNSVTSIGEYAFSHCYSLTSVTIPNSVTSIGNRAFQNCTSLTSVTIGNSVTSIGRYAFLHCSSLTSVTNEATTPQAIYSSVFAKVEISKIPLYVPAQSVELYKAADVWKKFASIQAIPGTTTGYTITWQNEDGSVLEKDENVAEGTIPTYDGATPTKTTATTQGNYVFTGWTPDIVAVTADATYTATFQAVQPSYNVIIQAEHGRVKVTATFPEQSNVTVEADNDAAPTFKQWSDGSTDLPRTVPAAEGDSTTAEFNRLDYTITGEKVQ